MILSKRDRGLETRITVAYDEFMAPNLSRAELWRRSVRLATLQRRRRAAWGYQKEVELGLA